MSPLVGHRIVVSIGHVANPKTLMETCGDFMHIPRPGAFVPNPSTCFPQYTYFSGLRLASELGRFVNARGVSCEIAASTVAAKISIVALISL